MNHPLQQNRDPGNAEKLGVWQQTGFSKFCMALSLLVISLRMATIIVRDLQVLLKSRTWFHFFMAKSS